MFATAKLTLELFPQCDVTFRLYLINSPVVRADNLRFKEEGVRDVVKDVFLPWFNAYKFLMQNVARLQRISVLSSGAEVTIYRNCHWHARSIIKFLSEALFLVENIVGDEKWFESHYCSFGSGIPNCTLFLQEDGVDFVYSENTMILPDNYVDRWIISFTQSLIKFVKAEMTGK